MAELDITRIKSNIERMIASNAPETDIDAYVSGEGVTPEQLRAPASRGMADKLLGIGGPRFQTWPERAVRGLANLPEKTMTAAASEPPGSRELTRNLVEPATETAAAFSPLSRAARVPGVKPTPGPAPTIEKLNEAGAAGYEQARKSGVTVPPQAIEGMRGQIEEALIKEGYLPATAPKVFGVIKAMEPPSGALPVGVAEMMAMRKSFQKAAADHTESDAARRSIEIVDQMMGGLHPGLEGARGNFAAAFRASDVDARLSRADRQAARSGSGAGLDNAIRQKISAVLDVPSRTRGFSPEELAQMEKIVMGTTTGNIARTASKLSPQHPMTGWPALAAPVMTGAALGRPGTGAAIGLGLNALGVVSKKVAEKSSTRQAEALDEMIRRRSPLYKETAPTSGEVPTSINAIVRILLEGEADKKRRVPMRDKLIEALGGR